MPPEHARHSDDEWPMPTREVLRILERGPTWGPPEGSMDLRGVLSNPPDSLRRLIEEG
jgi:hypothetical protein